MALASPYSGLKSPIPKSFARSLNYYRAVIFEILPPE